MAVINHLEVYDNISSYPSHSHISCEMIFVLDGKITMSAGEDDYVISKGQLCLVPVGVVHSTEKNAGRYKRWLLNFNPWELARRYFSVDIQALLLGIRIKRPVITTLGESGCRIFQHLYEEHHSQKPFSEDVALSDLIYLLALLARDNPPVNDETLSETAQLVMRVQVYIQENCTQALRISEVAEKFYANKFYLTHVFTQHTGMSPKQFQISCRLQKAELLLLGDDTVSNISEQCGFASLSDFTGRFSAKYGCTPAQYRKRQNDFP